METQLKTINELIETNEYILPLGIIPNNMGSNLSSVEAISWTKQEDGQLIKLTIHFVPSKDA